MFNAPQRCPTCGHGVEVREVSCPSCETVVRGRWSPGPFARLTPDQQTFLALFVRSRGNLSEVERMLGVSYPTVRAKLEEVIDALDPEETPREDEPAPQSASAPGGPTEREGILAAIARGELTVEAGMERLRQQGVTDGS